MWAATSTYKMTSRYELILSSPMKWHVTCNIRVSNFSLDFSLSHFDVFLFFSGYVGGTICSFNDDFIIMLI